MPNDGHAGNYITTTEIPSSMDIMGTTNDSTEYLAIGNKQGTNGIFVMYGDGGSISTSITTVLGRGVPTSNMAKLYMNLLAHTVHLYRMNQKSLGLAC
ncbi:hypothetical protein HNP38_002900 [Chryseobacterium defluvii]|uniref:Uncharacterized protein n=1 Tax=Chryseobacterium defluvii TaxID=160396 RepID=A0A840KIT4_9FLAO|nr:hypothetical protein [Chryseobacterium defluvii]MBB4807594.1 hypothetical protein [Chryseobacterium defluvii]